jgi:hypothetical protein
MADTVTFQNIDLGLGHYLHLPVGREWQQKDWLQQAELS